MARFQQTTPGKTVWGYRERIRSKGRTLRGCSGGGSAVEARGVGVVCAGHNIVVVVIVVVVAAAAAASIVVVVIVVVAGTSCAEQMSTHSQETNIEPHLRSPSSRADTKDQSCTRTNSEPWHSNLNFMKGKKE